jgi:RNA polymerase sigma factor (sigma-70 family)
MTQEQSSEFSKLYNTYSIPVIRIVQRRVHDADVAKDIVQEVFIKVLKNIDKFHHVENMGGYIYGIVHNEIVSYVKKAKRKAEIDGEFMYTTNRSNDTVEKYNDETFDKLDELIANLPKKQKRVIQLKLQGLRYDAIAKKMRISIDTVNHQLTVVYKKLRTGFNPQP